MASGRNHYRRWTVFSDIFNGFVMDGDMCKDKQRLSMKYAHLLRDAKKETNPVKRKAMEDVAWIIKSIMQ